MNKFKDFIKNSWLKISILITLIIFVLILGFGLNKVNDSIDNKKEENTTSIFRDNNLANNDSTSNKEKETLKENEETKNNEKTEETSSDIKLEDDKETETETQKVVEKETESSTKEVETTSENITTTTTQVVVKPSEESTTKPIIIPEPTTTPIVEEFQPCLVKADPGEKPSADGYHLYSEIKVGEGTIYKIRYAYAYSKEDYEYWSNNKEYKYALQLNDIFIYPSSSEYVNRYSIDWFTCFYKWECTYGMGGSLTTEYRYLLRIPDYKNETKEQYIQDCLNNITGEYYSDCLYLDKLEIHSSILYDYTRYMNENIKNTEYEKYFGIPNGDGGIEYYTNNFITN